MRRRHPPSSLLYPLLPLSITACTAATRPHLTRSDLVDDVEYAHGKRAWRAHQAFQADIRIDFPGRPPVDGTLTLTTDGRKARLDTRDGRRLVFDGQRAWCSPAARGADDARFTLLVWPYFVAVPFRLRDANAHTVDYGQERVNGIEYKVLRLTFDPGTGDLSDDWFRIYVDDETRRIGGMAYVDAYAHKLTDPPPRPRAITFDDFTNVGGATIATTWYFRNWSEEKGFDPAITGTAHLTDPKFVTPPPDFFDKPADAKEDPRSAAE